jgi:hypothetical protein
MAERDLSFESLVESTGATIAAERGALNAALKAIREQEPELDDEDLALLIRLRAEDYRRLYPGMALTPTALSKHWNRVWEEVQRSHSEHARAAAELPVRICPTCGGDKIVVVSVRPSRSVKNPTSGFEECAPCPDCNGQVISWWRQDGTHRVTPDPAQVRRMLGG